MATCTRDHVPHYMTHETILTMPLPHLWIQTSRFHCSNVTEIGTRPCTDTTTMYACICTVSLLIRWSSARHIVHRVCHRCLCMAVFACELIPSARVCVRMVCMYACIRHKHSIAKNVCFVCEEPKQQTLVYCARMCSVQSDIWSTLC